MPRLEPVGRCIYCLKTDQLSDEHIIPISLGGDLILPLASCEDCRKITCEFERVVAKEMYGLLRLRLGILGNRKRRKKRKTHWPMGKMNKITKKIESVPIPVQDTPPFWVTVQMPTPGILRGEPFVDKCPEIRITLHRYSEGVAEFSRKYGISEIHGEFEHDQRAFNQMLAKIAHSFTAAIIGTDGYEKFLTPIIIGDEPRTYHFIGGTSSEDEIVEPPNILKIEFFYLNLVPYLRVWIRLFPQLNYPTYQVVVGRVTDLDLIVKKIALANAR